MSQSRDALIGLGGLLISAIVGLGLLIATRQTGSNGQSKAAELTCAEASRENAL